MGLKSKHLEQSRKGNGKFVKLVLIELDKMKWGYLSLERS